MRFVGFTCDAKGARGASGQLELVHREGVITARFNGKKVFEVEWEELSPELKRFVAEISPSPYAEASQTDYVRNGATRE